MGNTKKKVREASQRITEVLKKIPEHVDIKCGAELELIPKPVWKLFFEIHILNSLIKKEQENKNANRKKSNKRLHSDDEGVSEQDTT